MPRRMLAWACSLTIASVAMGCGHKLEPLALINRPPEIALDPAVDAPITTSDRIAHCVSWTASDPDGRVDHYLVTVDPASLRDQAAGWTRTVERSRVVTSRRPQIGASSPVERVAREFEVFGVRAVDERGAMSEPKWRGFFGDNVAPTVQILTPRPSPILEPIVAPLFHIRWEGSDPDSPNPRRLTYKFKLFPVSRDSEFPIEVLFSNPDSLRKFYAPEFRGWESLRGDSNGVQLTGLTADRSYVFVVTMIDEHGAYDPVFSRSKNMLAFTVGRPGFVAPRFHVFNESFSYYYSRGGRFTDPETFIRVTLPAPGPITIHWATDLLPGALSVRYRWALDPPSYETARWTRWNEDTRSATLGPYPGAEPEDVHHLYIEAQDSNGETSLAVVQFQLVRATLHRELLIVDDTRFPEDMRAPGSVDSILPPSGNWPSAAELDTFLYARGDVPWRMAPPGFRSAPGVFNGYSYDTLGTRFGVQNPRLPIEVLAQYRHIIWITDQMSSLFRQGEIGGGPGSPTQPQTLLRYMTDPNQQNTLALYASMGGKLWLLGGGIANATLATWNNRSNDAGGRIYSSVGTRPELIPERFMHAFAHLRSEIRETYGRIGSIQRSVHAGGPGAGRYARLPAALEVRSPATDPLPPLRSPFTFYPRDLGLEVLTVPNLIGDPKNPSPRHATDLQSLDTLYVASGGGVPVRPVTSGDAGLNPCMTYYHGIENGTVVFSGFDIWSFKRSQCVQLVDAVLQDLWGLQRGSTGAQGPVGTRRREE